MEGSDVNQESEVATPAALFVTVTPLAASVSLRNCFTSSLSTPSFVVDRGRTNLTLDGSGCVDLTGDGSSTTQFSFSVYGTADTTDEPDELVTLTISEDPDNLLPTGFSIDSNANSAFVTIRDDDPTLVELARAGTGAVREGGTVEFTVTLGRDLVAGEAIDVPLSIGGTDVDTDDWSLALKTGAGLNTGVALSRETTATPQLAFSGAAARTATLTLTALLDDDAGAETLVVALGPDDATANGFDRDGLATNVGGGADPSPTANRFEVTVNDPPAPAAPAGFAAAAGDSEAVLSWTDPSNAAIGGYEFRQRTPPGAGAWGSWTAIASSTAATTTHTVTGLTNGTAYGFEVRAVSGGVAGAASSEATATPTAAGVATATTDGEATEGSTTDTATFTVNLNTVPSSNVTVTVTAPAGLTLDGPDAGATFASSEAIPFDNTNWSTAQTVTVRATDDSTDSPIGRELTVTYAAASSDTGYSGLSGEAATVTVVDNDPTAVTLAGAAGDVVEGGTKTFTITLNRGLVNGETLPVPLTFGTGTGTATRGTDYTTACPTTLPTGVACANLDSGNAMVTFTGPSTGTTATQVTLTLTAATDGTTESGGETVVIGLGTLNANSGTGLGGGASGTDSLADFSITDPDTSVPTVEITGVPDRISGTANLTATFTFSEDVTGFATDDVTVTGGTKGTFTATSATVYTLVVTPDGGANVVVTVAEDSATDGTNTGPASAETATAVWTALVFSSAAVTVVEEASATYTVALSSQPDANVTVTVGGASGEVTFDTDSTTPGTQTTALTFSTINWSTARTVTVLAAADNDTENDSATLTHTAAGGGYDSVTGSVAVTVTDNDTVGVTTAQPSDRQVTEGSTTDTATFTVVLNTPPSDNVAVTVTAPDGLELAGPGSSTFGGSALLAFISSTWSAPQTVTVRATDDNTDSPIGRELTVTYSTSSRDSNYHTLSGTAATVTVVDNDPTAVTLAGTAGDVVEGGTKTFTVTLNRGLVNGEALPVPLTFDGGATRGTDYTTACPATLPTGVSCNNLNTDTTPTVTFTGPSTGTTATTVTLTLSAVADNADEASGETVVIGLGTLDANSGTGLGGGASGTDTLADFRINDPDSSAPTVEISGVPGTINNRDAFTATFTFSEAVTGFVKDDITVIGGTAGDFTATSATVYTLVVTPNADADVVVTVAADSATAGTNTGPASAVSATAVWTLPPGLVFSSTALTVAEGGSGTYTVKLATQPTVTVTVTVGGASGEVTVDTDANTNGNQRTLIFTATNWGTARTVTVLAGEDEDSVNDTATLTHRASGGGYGSVTGTVVVTVTDNDEPSVFGGFAAWMPRFARVASEQILQGIGERVALHRGQGATGSAGAGRGDGAMAFEGVLAGQALVTGGGFADGGRGISAVPGRPAAGGAAQAMVERARGFGEEASDPFGDRLGAPRSQTLGAREALLGTAFTLTGERDGAGGTMAFWGQAGRGNFDGRERTLLLDGEVTTGMLGVDYAWDRALVGLALTRSEGEGGYRDMHSASRAGDGEVEASLTAALPYASVHATPRLKLWGAAGRGGGEVTLKTPDARYRANTEWTMAAAGMRGDFLTPLPEGAGASLALTADALWTRITSDRTRGLAASASSVTRVRLGLEGRYPLALDGDGQLTPRFEARARQDGGDAETGRGFELGAGLAFSDPALGLTLDLSGRTLIAHTDDDMKERGYQASLAFDPDPATKRGPSLGLRQEFGGRAEGGLDALFASAPLGERTGRGAKPRWAMETAWGFPALGGRFTASPHAGLGLAADAREISLGWRLTPEASTAPDLSLGLKAARRERNTALPQHTFGVEATLRW